MDFLFFAVCIYKGKAAVMRPHGYSKVSSGHCDLMTLPTV